MRSKMIARGALALFLLEVALAVVSWLLSALQLGGLDAGHAPAGVRSLIGSEGIRWFFGRFASMLAAPQLVWLLLFAMTLGIFRRCGISGALRRRRAYRERVALFFSVLVAAVLLSVVAVLALSPHALLLSATGSLFPSPFSASIVPSSAFIVISMSAVYGLTSGRFTGVADVCDSLFAGISWCAPVFLYYILLTQLCYSVVFVFG